jgi:hypothetical protein
MRLYHIAYARVFAEVLSSFGLLFKRPVAMIDSIYHCWTFSIIRGIFLFTRHFVCWLYSRLQVICCYEGESVNSSQMDIKRKTCDIRTRKKYLFLDMSSTNTETLVPSLYQCVEPRSIEVLRLLSEPLPHLRFNLFVISEAFATQL